MILLLMAWVINAYSQQLVSSAGETVKTPQLQMDWSLGEIMTETYSNFGTVVLQGLHHGIHNTGPALIVFTRDVTDITQTSATTGGSVQCTQHYTVIAYGVCWSTQPGPTLQDNHTVDGSGTGCFWSYLTGLTPSTTYYVRAYAINNENEVFYGVEKWFRTLDPIFLPQVITYDISQITTTSAVGGGEVVNSGGAAVSQRGICWNTDPMPTTDHYHTVDGSGMGSFQSQLTGLEPNTTYYVRAYAINIAGIGYGQQVIFTTEEEPLVPVIRIVQNLTVTTGNALCFDAIETILVAGNGTTFTVEQGAAATFVAGLKILFLPGTLAMEGCMMRAYITTEGVYCNTPSAVAANQPGGINDRPELADFEVTPVKIYPNPTQGWVNIVVNFTSSSGIFCNIFNTENRCVIKNKHLISGFNNIDLSELPKGIYYIRITEQSNTYLYKVLLF